jgi:hypothetical protein
MKLKTVRPGAAPNTWTVISQSELASAVTGENVFSSRVPITAGDRIAMYSATASTYCAPTGAGDTLVAEAPAVDTANGDTVTAPASVNARLAMFAIIEADADGDGYGDESQDFCPQSKDFQIACPTVALSKFVIAGRNSLSILATANVATTATLTGSARMPAIKGSRASTIKFKAISKALTPGTITTIKVANPRKLKAALRKLPKSAKVKVTMELKASGLINTDTEKIRATFRP